MSCDKTEMLVNVFGEGNDQCSMEETSHSSSSHEEDFRYVNDDCQLPCYVSDEDDNNYRFCRDSGSESSSFPFFSCTSIGSSAMLIYGAAGVMVGSLAAMLGFQGLVIGNESNNSTPHSLAHLLIAAAVWSAITLITSHFVYKVLETAQQQQELFELKASAYKPCHITQQNCFNGGLFVGLCLGCWATDLIYDLPPYTVQSSAGAATLWLIVTLIYTSLCSTSCCDCRQRHVDNASLPSLV